MVMYVSSCYFACWVMSCYAVNHIIRRLEKSWHACCIVDTIIATVYIISANLKRYSFILKQGNDINVYNTFAYTE